MSEKQFAALHQKWRRNVSKTQQQQWEVQQKQWTKNSKLNENEKMTVASTAPTTPKSTAMKSNKYNNCGETVPLNAAAQFYDYFGMCSKK